MRRLFSFLFYTVMLVAALGLGLWAWQSMHQAVVVVEWSTASELDTVGFYIYRSDRPQGPFTRMNASLIPASPDPLTGGSYRYEDHSVVPGRTYYYQLEDADNQGTSTRHGPIEVTAEGAGWVEAVLALGLAGMAGWGFYTLRRRAAQGEPEKYDELSA